MSRATRQRVEFARFTDDEKATVDRIVERAVRMFREAGVTVRPADVEMDISAVHARTPLRLDELADADDFNFGHDLGGIRNCLNRKTGELENHFLPRFTARATR